LLLPYRGAQPPSELLPSVLLSPLVLLLLLLLPLSVRHPSTEVPPLDETRVRHDPITPLSTFPRVNRFGMGGSTAAITGLLRESASKLKPAKPLLALSSTGADFFCVGAGWSSFHMGRGGVRTGVRSPGLRMGVMASSRQTRSQVRKRSNAESSLRLIIFSGFMTSVRQTTSMGRKGLEGLSASNDANIIREYV